MTTHSTPLEIRPRPAVTHSDRFRVLALGAIAGPALFTVAWVILSPALTGVDVPRVRSPGSSCIPGRPLRRA